MGKGISHEDCRNSESVVPQEAQIYWTSEFSTAVGRRTLRSTTTVDDWPIPNNPPSAQIYKTLCPFITLARGILVQANVILKKKHTTSFPTVMPSIGQTRGPPQLTDRVRDGVLPGLGYRWVWSNGGAEIRREKPKGLYW